MDYLETGTLVDHRFEVERRAGVGGVGRVSRVEDRQSGDTVALKARILES